MGEAWDLSARPHDLMGCAWGERCTLHGSPAEVDGWVDQTTPSNLVHVVWLGSVARWVVWAEGAVEVWLLADQELTWRCGRPFWKVTPDTVHVYVGDGRGGSSMSPDRLGDLARWLENVVTDVTPDSLQTV